MANSLAKRGLLGVLGVVVFLAFAGAVIWLRGNRRPSFLNVTIGNTPVADVEEQGFFAPESDGNGPFRWTNGHGKLVIPVDRDKPPKILVVYLESYRAPGTRSVPLRIALNAQDVFNDDVRVGRWRQTFDLEKMDLGDKLTVEIITDTFRPQGVMDEGTNSDPRALGIQVREIKLVRDPAPPGEAKP